MRSFLVVLLSAIALSVMPAFASIGDKDDDGIKNKDDQCPTQAEDIDNFHDNDGCPDADNDMDGLLDGVDKCPNDGEDIDGFQDADGCPDPDNDGDGLPDVRDACPNQKEDFDGYQDADGCPDADNDSDGIVDSLDKCPIVPEDMDRFEDTDGCPDVDNDQDGIPDAKDKCPTQKENVNNYQDEDGCPDESTPEVPYGVMELEGIRFPNHTADLDFTSYAPLDALIKSLLAHASIELDIIAYTDKSEDPEEDYALGMQMAQAVIQYLSSKGVGEERLTAKSMGSAKPIASNVTPTGRIANRRVEISRRK